DVEVGLDDRDKGSFDRLAYDRLRQALLEFRDLANQVEALSRINSVSRSIQLTLGEATRIGNDSENVLGRLRDLYSKRVAAEKADSETGYVTARWLMIGATVFGTLLSVGLSLLLTRSITRPLQHAAELAGCIAQGDLTRRLNLGQRDEIGQL